MSLVFEYAEETGWGEPGHIRDAVAIGERWFHDHPDAAELQRRAELAAAELERAREASRRARAVLLERPEVCGARAGAVECHRLTHPVYEPHEDWMGLTWWPGQEPKHTHGGNG